MKEQITFRGRSLVFNSVFVLLNLSGIAFMVLGYHENFADNASLFKLIGLMLLIFSTGALIVFKGRYMMSSVARVIVGGLFIVSGLVKANDPLGFSFKLEEYFEDGALAFRIKEWFGMPGFSMEGLIDYALILSVLICIAEIVLGVLTIIGGKIKLVSYLMLFMMLFFTFLTWHTANCDKDATFKDHDTYALTDPMAQTKMDMAKDSKEIKVLSKTSTEVVIEEIRTPQCVDDCGCFGDAMKGSVGRSLTPQESLWKDIVLLYLVIWIFVAQWIIKPNTRKQNLVYAAASTSMVIFFSWVFGWYFPIFFALLCIFGALWMLRVGGKYLGNHWGSSLLVTLLCTILTTYVLMYEPIKDYRPYAVGADLWANMNDGTAEENQDMVVYRNTKTGETREYGATSQDFTDSKIWENTDFVYDTMIKKIIVPGKLCTIDSAQFNPFRNISEISEYELALPAVKEQMKKAFLPGLKLYDIQGEAEIEIPMEEYNVTDYDAESYKVLDTIRLPNPDFSEVSVRNLIVKAKRAVVVISKDLNEGNWTNIDRLKEIFAACKKKNVPFIVVCGASNEQIVAFRKKHKFYAPFFVNDGTELKAITRSNPALMVIEKGIVKAKYPFRSTPTKESFKSNHLN